MGLLQTLAVACLVRIISLFIGFLALGVFLVKWCIKGNQIFYVKPRPSPPPILNDKKWGTHGYMNLNGIKLHYVEKGDSSKPLIVCLHGFPEFWFSWRHQLKEFSSQYWVVAVDMRGYGDSDKPPKCSDYQTAKIVEDIRKFIIALGKDKCTLIAHDWGALIAWELVARYPAMFLRHVSMNGPHPTAFMKILKSSFAQKRRSWYIAFFQNPWLPEMLLRTEDLSALEKMFKSSKKLADAFDEETMEAYKYNYSRDNAFTPPINYYRNIPFAEPLTLPRIRVPTLIIWGTADKALLKEIAKMSAEECQDVQVKYVDGASHWVQQEEPVYVNKLLWEYFSITN